MKKPVPLLPACFKPSFVRRFWLRVDVRGKDECWPWIGDEKFTGKFYGTLKLGKKVVTASRVANAISTGIDPQENPVLHSCDNPPCCNPEHLHCGTRKKQAMDMVARGRWRTGKSDCNKKLTDDDVSEVWTMIAKRKTNVEIGEIFGVHHSTISAIRCGKSWPGHFQPWTKIGRDNDNTP